MLLVDAYNVLFAWRPALRGRGPSDRDRDEFIAEMARHCAATRQKARLYFDPGPGFTGPGTSRRQGNVEVVHLPPGTIADQAIREEVARERDTTALRVVSSDNEVWREAARRGFPTVRAEDFLAELDSSSPRRGSEKPEGASVHEAEAWLKEMMGDRDEAGR